MERTFTSFTSRIRNIGFHKKASYLVATIPKEVVEEMDLKDGEYLLLLARKAKWYDLLNWDEMEALQERLRGEKV